MLTEHGGETLAECGEVRTKGEMRAVYGEGHVK